MKWINQFSSALELTTITGIWLWPLSWQAVKRGMEEAERIVARRIVTDFFQWYIDYIASTVCLHFPHFLLRGIPTIVGILSSITQWPRGTSGQPPSHILLSIIENMIGSAKRKCIRAPSATRSSIGPQTALQEGLVQTCLQRNSSITTSLVFAMKTI